MNRIPISVLRNINNYLEDDYRIYFDKGYLYQENILTENKVKISNKLEEDNIKIKFYRNTYIGIDINGDLKYILIDGEWKLNDNNINNINPEYKLNFYGFYDEQPIFVSNLNHYPLTLINKDGEPIGSISRPFTNLDWLGLITQSSNKIKLNVYKGKINVYDPFNGISNFDFLVIIGEDVFKECQFSYKFPIGIKVHIYENKIFVITELELVIYEMIDLDNIKTTRQFIPIDDYKKVYFSNHKIYFYDYANQLFNYDYVKNKTELIMEKEMDIINIKNSHNENFNNFINQISEYQEQKYLDYISNIV
jgi:hypothetical protein